MESFETVRRSVGSSRIRQKMDRKRSLLPDWMVTPAYGLDLQFERIAINEGALCIECKACGRRAALTFSGT